MIRIRYLAFLCDDPDGLAGFYKEQLDLEQLGRNNHGDVALTDGYIKFALFALRSDLGEPRMERGLPPLPHQAHVTCDQTPEARARRSRWLAGRSRCQPTRKALRTTPWTEMKRWVWPADLNFLICRSRWRAG